jgi:hypothetical protein
MNIPFNAPDPKSNLIEFKREKRTGTLEAVRAGYDACKHERLIISEEKRIVTCRACKTPLDPFTILFEFANKQRRWLDELDSWDAYRESKLAERYDLEWAEGLADIKGPPTDPEIRMIWDTFHAVLKDKFCGMYQRKKRKHAGPQWYGRSTSGGIYSYEFARQGLTPKVVPGGSR